MALPSQMAHAKGSVVITEESRYELYERLVVVLGRDEASTLMEHLPPVGWADVATKQDVEALRVATKRDFEAVHKDIAALRQETHKDIAALRDETHKDIAALRDETHKDIAALRQETHKDIAALRQETQIEFNSVRAEIASLRDVTEERFDHTVALFRAELNTSAATLRGEMAGLRGEIGVLRGEMGILRGDMNTGFESIRVELHKGLKQQLYVMLAAMGTFATIATVLRIL